MSKITIKDLVSRMENNLADSEHSAYSHTHMQLKLQEHFGDRVILTEVNGKPNAVTFRNKAEAVLRDFYSQNEKADPDTDKARRVEAAAKLIRDDIKAVETPHGVYPACDELGSDETISFLSKSLRALLEGIIVGKGVQKKNCFYRTSDNASNPTTSFVSTTAGWLSCATSSSFCITLPD